MTKKDYLKPAMTVFEADFEEQILAGSVLTTGLGGDDLIEDDTPGDSWEEAMSRSRNVWDDDEEW